MEAYFYEESPQEGRAHAAWMVQSLASLPGFVKTAVMLHFRSERERVLRHALMKRIVLHWQSLVYQNNTSAAVVAEVGGGGEDHKDEVNLSAEEEPPANISATQNSSSSDRLGEISSIRTMPGSSVVFQSWLLEMLASTQCQMRAIEYMEHISNMTLEDYRQLRSEFQPTSSSSPQNASLRGTLNRTGSGPTLYYAPQVTKSEEELLEDFTTLRQSLLDRISKFRFLTSLLLGLSSEQIEQCVALPVVQHAVREATKRPFCVFLNGCDFLFHVVILVAWRRWLLLDFEAYRTQVQNNEPWPPLTADVGFFLTFCCGAYFMFRWLADTIALGRVNWKLGLFNILSLQFAILTILIVLMMIVTFVESSVYVTLGALSFGFVWIKVILFLQAANETLAKYILALVQVRERRQVESYCVWR